MATVFLPLVPGQEMAKQYFQRAMSCGRLSHAYLFLGPEGAGKRLFARELAKAFFCESGNACGECTPCRSIAHGNHPSVELYEPVEGKTAIDIDTIRELCTRVQYKTNRVHIAVLEQAELLTEPAANALLKTLEEPPGDAIFILTSQSAGTLLPTIVSRCHRILFTGPRVDTAPLPEETRAWLEEVTLPGFFARWDVKDWLAAREIKDSGTVRQQVRQLLDGLIEAKRSRISFASDADLDGVLRRMETLLDLRQDVDRNVNPDLVLERLFRELRRAFWVVIRAS